MDDFEASEQRSLPIVKANYLIRNAKYDMEINELIGLAYVLSKVKTSEHDFEDITFSIRDYCKVVGITCESGKTYNDVKSLMKRISDFSCWIDEGNGQETLFRWFSRVVAKKKTGTVTVRLSDDLKRYLLELDGNFTKVILLNELAMTSKYSVKLYEFLKSYEWQKGVIVDIEQLKKALACEQYTDFCDIRRRAIDVACEEINRLTDINVGWIQRKEGRKVVAVQFVIQEKQPMDQLSSVLEAEKTVRSKKKRPQKADFERETTEGEYFTM